MMQEFLSAPVPYIAGVLEPPALGYEEGVLVLQPRTDTIVGVKEEGAGWLPSAPVLDELVDKLTLPHEHLSRRIVPLKEGGWSRGITKLKSENSTEVSDESAPRYTPTSRRCLQPHVSPRCLPLRRTG